MFRFCVELVLFFFCNKLVLLFLVVVVNRVCFIFLLGGRGLVSFEFMIMGKSVRRFCSGLGVEEMFVFFSCYLLGEDYKGRERI